MEKEAEAAALKAEASERAAAADAEMASARKKAQHDTDKISMLMAELKRKEKITEQVARDHQLRRVMGLVRRSGG